MADQSKQPTSYSYGKGKWWEHQVQSHRLMVRVLRGQHLEQNHLVHAAFLRHGPPETRHLEGWVPCITLSQTEHRGSVFSYHMMKDKQRVETAQGSFEGCGMDAYLASRGLKVRQGRFSRDEVLKAIDVSADYWRMIGMTFAANALTEFRDSVFNNPQFHRTTESRDR